jgi:hypothetical protein
MANSISDINQNFDEIKSLFVELEESMSILLIGKLICSDDIDEINKLTENISEKINYGKSLLDNLNIDKKSEVKNIYEKYEIKIKKFKELFKEHFLYE